MINQQKIGKVIRYLIFLSVISVSSIAFAQTKTDEFFTQKESQFIKAYKEKDTSQYLGLMEEFLEFYGKLDQPDGEKYKNHKINAYYNLGCTYAVLNDKEKATIYLKKALESGYTNYSQLISDADLNSIREERAYLESVASLSSIFDYLYVLSIFLATIGQSPVDSSFSWSLTSWFISICLCSILGTLPSFCLNW